MIEDSDQRERPKTLHTEKVFAQDDDKKFFIDLRENERGRFVQITERFKDRHSSVMIPAAVLGDVISALESVEKVEGQLQ
jgi:hypothetical protein